MTWTAEQNERHKAWRAANREKLNAQSRERYAARREEFRAKARARTAANPGKKADAHRAWRAANPEKAKEYYLKDPARNLFLAARSRAKKSGVPFSIDVEDVRVPDVCPVFGTPFVLGGGSGFQQHAPTLDRIENAKGYIKGNVQVISWRANRIKGDATVDELRKLLEYMTRV